MFRLVSCPNYLGEILEYAGWAIATWSLAGTAFLIFTIANLLPRAYSHHCWFHRRFPAYPATRKALTSFIW
jgi:3-oxo-5-alpha-steroid 4-dehydrogenase 1